MKIIHAAPDLKPGPGGVCAAIGVFDGVHLGHQRVIGQAIESARECGATSAVVTFDRHPSAVVSPKNVPPMIYPLSKKLEVVESLGVDATYLIPFDKAASEITGEQFIRNLARDFGCIRALCVGEAFMFGYRRSGNVTLLRKVGAELGFKLHALPDVSLMGQPVSSTRIREAVRNGEFEFAGEMLGRPYALCGTVIGGERMGRKLGYPTANMDVTGILVPPSGVYSAEAKVLGEVYRAAVNIGHRPTLHSAEARLCVEAHLLDFDSDIYGKEIELTFRGKLREEQKFGSLAALRDQIERDVAAARELEIKS